MAFKIGLN